MYWRHIVASTLPGGAPASQPSTAGEAAAAPDPAPEPGADQIDIGTAEAAGGTAYQDRHYGMIFKKGLSFSGFERDHLFLNGSTGPGNVSFADVSKLSGADSDGDGRSVLVADVDDDGDDDLLVLNLQRRRFQLFRNERHGGAEHGFLKLRLRAAGANTRGIGAVVRVTPAGGRTSARPVMAGHGFQSQHSAWLTFGLGKATTADVEVIWPGGAHQRFSGLAAGSRLLLTEGVAHPTTVEARTFALPDPPIRGMSGVTAKQGEVLPPLRLGTMAGKVERWSPASGRPTVLHLWATWCKSCDKEMPDLAGVAKRLAEDRPDVDVVTLAMQSGGAEEVARFLESRGVSLPTYLGQPERLPALVDGDGMLLPTSLIFDAEGRLVEGLQGTTAVAGIEPAIRRLGPPHAQAPRPQGQR